jgi:NitT/TauT family transport system substrate-binding protein
MLTVKKPGGITTRGKIVIATLFVGLLAILYFSFRDKITKFAGGATSGDVIKIGVVTWPGYIGGEYMNNGFAPNMECRFYKEYGIQVEFKVLNDFLASRKAFESGEVDLLWCTADAFPTEMGREGTMALSNPKFLFQSDWSRGGDAIVVDMSIDKISDLKGKTVAVAEGTPSHSFLINLLKANNMTLSDIDVKSVPSAVDAADVFKQGACVASVVWSPDDIDCLKKVSGSKVLASTKEATYIIADGFIAKDEYIKKNIEKLQKLYDGWMVGAAEINANKDGARNKAAKILADNFQMTEKDALASLDNVRLANHGDNKNFFGLGESNCVTGDMLYTTMSGEYQKIKKVENPLMWREVSDAVLVKASTLTGNGQLAEVSKKFTPAGSDVKERKAYSTKKVTINFPSGSYALTGEAKAKINREYSEIAKTNGGARIRVEGNTDNSGNPNFNQTLSYNRAKAVAEYLTNQFGFDFNRFIVIGNGSKHAIDAGSKGDDENYRTTDFGLIKE